MAKKKKQTKSELKGRKPTPFEIDPVGIGRKGGLSHAPRQPEFSLNRPQKELMLSVAEIGLGVKECARAFGVDERTLSDYIKREIEAGSDFGKKWLRFRAQGDAKLAKKAFTLALEGNAGMLKYLLAMRLKWRENASIEISGPEGGPIETVALAPDMSPEAAARLYSKIRDGTAAVIEGAARDVTEGDGDEC